MPGNFNQVFGLAALTDVLWHQALEDYHANFDVVPALKARSLFIKGLVRPIVRALSAKIWQSVSFYTSK